MSNRNVGLGVEHDRSGLLIEMGILIGFGRSTYVAVAPYQLITMRTHIRCCGRSICLHICSKNYPELLAMSANMLSGGHVLDLEDKPIKGACEVRKDHKDLAVWDCDSRGRFDVTLEIGYLYSVQVWKEGFVKKQFIVDARAEDPTKVNPIPFEAFITLLPSAGLKEKDLDELDFPFALIYYKEKNIWRCCSSRNAEIVVVLVGIFLNRKPLNGSGLGSSGQALWSIVRAKSTSTVLIRSSVAGFKHSTTSNRV